MKDVRLVDLMDVKALQRIQDEFSKYTGMAALTTDEKGIPSSVDDFGTGYSSLNMLREAPWEVLKIDRSYLPDSKKYDEKRQSMLKYSIAIASDMGFGCIVEGVETLEQLKMIKRNNCFMAQGFYFDKPLPVEEFEEKLIYE